MVTFDSDTMIKSPGMFSYEPDPVVYGVDSYKTIVRYVVCFVGLLNTKYVNIKFQLPYYCISEKK